MSERSGVGQLAARAIEVLVTHNEAVSGSDLACALGVSDARAWHIARSLSRLGYVTLDETSATMTATPEASDPSQQTRRDELVAGLDHD